MFSNPAILFMTIWSITMLLYSMQLSLLLRELSFEMIAYIFLTFVAAIIGSVFMSKIKKKPVIVNVENHNYSDDLIKNRIVYFFFGIFIVVSLVELLHFGSFPIFMASSENTHMYLEFSSYLGLMHTLAGKASMLAVTLIFFFLYLKTKKKIYLFLYAMVIIWSILIIARSNIITIALQSIFLSSILGYKIFTVRRIIAILVLIYLFGLLGNIRVGEGGQNMDIYKASLNYPDFLPDGFIMTYVYIVSALNNVNYNLPHYYKANFEPSQLFWNYIPGVFKEEFDIKKDYAFQLVVDTFNTDTYMNDFLVAFGYYGSLIVLVLLFILYQFIYLKSKDSLKWKMILAVALSNIVLSVFSDSLTAPLFFFEIFYIYLILTNFRIHSKREMA